MRSSKGASSSCDQRWPFSATLRRSFARTASIACLSVLTDALTSLAWPKIVTREHRLIADVEFSAANHGVRPARPALIFDLKPPSFLIAGGAGVGESDHVAFPEQVEFPVSVSE